MREQAPNALQRLLDAGGTDRLNLIRFGVISATVEPVFLFLVSEFRLRPTATAAHALYDAFCAPQAPARLATLEALPPRDLRLLTAIGAFSDAHSGAREMHDVTHTESPPSSRTVVANTPGRNLFDPLVSALWAQPEGVLQRLERDYDAALSPEANLPGGRQSAAQRNFVDRVWCGRLRPRLVAAGFWQLSSIG